MIGTAIKEFNETNDLGLWRIEGRQELEAESKLPSGDIRCQIEIFVEEYGSPYNVPVRS